MRRLILVIVVAASILGLTLAHLYALALALGVAVGAGMFLLAQASGGGLGNARHFGRKPADVGARIGVALAAMGIAAEAIAVVPAPAARHFYTVCQGLGALIALVLAARSRPSGGAAPKE